MAKKSAKSGKKTALKPRTATGGAPDDTRPADEADPIPHRTPGGPGVPLPVESGEPPPKSLKRQADEDAKIEHKRKK